MGHLGVVLYEYLGEEYPEVLGSILGALKAIVNVIGTSLHHITLTNRDWSTCEWRTLFFFYNRYAQDDSSNQRPASSSHAHPEEQTWEGTGELYRPGGKNCWQVSEIRTYPLRISTFNPLFFFFSVICPVFKLFEMIPVSGELSMCLPGSGWGFASSCSSCWKLTRRQSAEPRSTRLATLPKPSGEFKWTDCSVYQKSLVNFVFHSPGQ